MPRVITFAALPPDRPTDVVYEPDEAERAALSERLGIRALRKLRLSGRLTPSGRSDWRFDGALGATAVQDCVVTLAPVTTRIDTPVERRFLEDLPEPEGGTEVEMPEDDTIEALPAELDLSDLASEALALALPEFPRAEGAELGDAVFTEPGKAAMTDEDAKPFAGLRALRDKLDPEP